MAEQGNIYVIGRDNYDALSPKESNSIYLVKENTYATSKMLSMYLGEGKQADVVDITGQATYDSITQNYDIPSKFQIKEKLLMNKETIDGEDHYRVFMWDGVKFVDCFSTTQNVHVYNELPNSGIDGNVYVITSGTGKGLYVNNGGGNNYINILSNYVTTDQVAQVVQENIPPIPEADGYTILNTNNTLHGGCECITDSRTIYYSDHPGMLSSGVVRQVGYSATTFNSPSWGYDETNNRWNGLDNAAVGYRSNAFGYHTFVESICGFGAGDGIMNMSNPSSFSTTIIGYNNKTGSVAVSDQVQRTHIFVVGNGSSRLSEGRSDALVLYNDGNLEVFGDRTSSTGNVKASTGVTLATIRESYSGAIPASSELTESYLPENGHEVLLSNSANSYATIKSITISDISKVVGNLDRTDDYSCTYIFKKDSTVTDIADLMPNFTSTNGAETTVSSAPPKIYLLNPDIDISAFDTIHIFIFFDGLKVCAIVAGYETLPTT